MTGDFPDTYLAAETESEVCLVSRRASHRRIAEGGLNGIEEHQGTTKMAGCPRRRVLGRDNDDPGVDCGGLPTVPVSGRRRHESQLLAPSYDVYDNI